MWSVSKTSTRRIAWDLASYSGELIGQEATAMPQPMLVGDHHHSQAVVLRDVVPVGFGDVGKRATACLRDLDVCIPGLPSTTARCQPWQRWLDFWSERYALALDSLTEDTLARLSGLLTNWGRTRVRTRRDFSVFHRHDECSWTTEGRSGLAASCKEDMATHLN